MEPVLCGVTGDATGATWAIRSRSAIVLLPAEPPPQGLQLRQGAGPFEVAAGGDRGAAVVVGPVLAETAQGAEFFLPAPIGRVQARQPPGRRPHFLQAAALQCPPPDVLQEEPVTPPGRVEGRGV